MCQTFSALALVVKAWIILKIREEDHKLVSKSINSDAVCRTAQPKPGLLNVLAQSMNVFRKVVNISI